MKKIFFILLLTHIYLFAQGSTTKIETFRVYPYQSIVMPQTPLVYFPARSISFGAGDITITDLTANKIYRGSDVSSFQGKFSIDATKIFERNEDFATNRNVGFPVAAYAEMTFFEPGVKYKISLDPSVGCSQCAGKNFGKFLGNNEFIVEVLYPKLLITPKLKEKYIFNDKNVGFNLFCKGLEDENLYTHTIEIKNGNEPTSATVKKMEGIKGSEVSLDLLLAELDNNNKYFRIVGYYNGKEIPLSANKVAEFWTKMEINFDEYKVESTWKQGTKENAPELDLTDEKNLTFDFYYELEGGQKIGIFNPVPSMDGESIIKINLEATQYKSKAKKDRFSIELYKSTFESFRKDQIIEIIFDFVDKDTKKSINKSLYCKKK